MKFLHMFFFKGLLILVLCTVAGLLFGVLPCYVFPLFGAKARDWCGFKSTPPHFVLQFWIGFLLMLAVCIYVAWFREK